MNVNERPRFCMVIAAAALMCGSAQAQNVNAGEIRGSITDSSGAVIPGVDVSIVNADTGVKKNFVTNSSGIYDALSLLPGPYTVTFSKDGFSKRSETGIQLRVEVITLNAQLTVGAAATQVEVQAEASELHTENSEQGTTLRAEAMKELPNIGQTWLNFTNTLPGTSQPGNARDGQAISVNGNERYEANFLADGGLAVLPRSNNLDSTLNFESIQELKVVTGSFDAQYGSGTAVFNQITKSGSNSFHGAVYEYFQNDDLNARSFFALTVPHSRKDQYGVGIGGPIKKDKLFFYFNWDSPLSHSATPTYVTYPTTAMRNGDFSASAFPKIYDPNSLNAQNVRTQFPGNMIPASRLDSVASAIEQYFPQPDLPGFVNNFYYNKLSISHPNTLFGKGDYNISNNNRLSYSLTRRLSRTVVSPLTQVDYPEDSAGGISRGFETQLTDVWTLSPSLVNEFRFAAVRQLSRGIPVTEGKGYPQKLGIDYSVADIFPNITIGGPVGSTSIGSGTSSVIAQISFVPSDVFTWVKGKHIMKFGGQWEANQDNGGNFGDTIGAALTFNPVFTASAPFGSGGLGYADFLTGQVSVWNALYSPIIGLRMKTGSMFAQDDYKIRSNLTLNLGVRLEIQGGWTEVGNRITVFDPTITNPATGTLGGMWWGGQNGRNALQETKVSVLPRVGFAWVPRQKWSVRGGFGTYTDRWGSDYYSNPAARTAGEYENGTLTETDAIHPVFIASAANPPLNLFIPGPNTRTPNSLNGQPVFYYPYNTPVARIYEGSFGIQREFLGMVAEVSYVGTYGKNLSFFRDLNQVPQNKLGPGNAQLNRPYPQFQNITAGLFDNKLNYNALQASLRKRLSASLNVDVNYTWSRNFVYQDSAGWSGSASSGPQDWQNAYNIAANYGPSNNDIPQQFKATVVYQIPVGKGRRWLTNSNYLADAVLGGWQSSGIFIRHSGAPFNPIMFNNNSGALVGTWYPNVVGNPVLANPTVSEWFNTAAFAAPASYTFGDSGRNNLRGPQWLSLDFSMGKNLRIPVLREGMSLQLRMDGMNIMNHPVFANPSSSVGSAGDGIITSTYVGGRTIQLGARLAF